MLSSWDGGEINTHQCIVTSRDNVIKKKVGLLTFAIRYRFDITVTASSEPKATKQKGTEYIQCFYFCNCGSFCSNVASVDRVFR